MKEEWMGRGIERRREKGNYSRDIIYERRINLKIFKKNMDKMLKKQKKVLFFSIKLKFIKRIKWIF